MMGPRRTIAKLACTIFFGPLFIYGIINLQVFMAKHDQADRTRLSLWKKSGYGKLVEYSAQSLSSSGEGSLNNSPSLNRKTTTTVSRLLGNMTMENMDEQNMAKLSSREEVKMALHRLDSAKLKVRDREIKTLNTQLDTDQTTELNTGYATGELKKSKLHSDLEMKETNELLETENEMDDYLDDEEELEDDPNLNVDVKRAMPVLQVKRYVDEPIDPHKYNYIHNPSKHCFNENGAPRKVFIMFMVVTAPGHFPRRNVIRHTYGSEKEWPPLKRGVFTTVFLLGKTSNETQQKMIDEEAGIHGDIVQEDFIDTYANLSRKTVMGLKWVTNYCRHAFYAMKIDDDSMINQGKFLWIFKDSSLTNWTASETLQDAPVLRNNTSKYFISKEYYPAPTYPPYMNGPGYLMSTDLVESSYHMALQTPLFPWEDVFLGTCLQKMGIKPVYHKRFLWISQPEFFRYNTERRIVLTIRSYVVLSNLQPDIMKFMWSTCKIKLLKS